jgi:hypothetical protein
MAVSAVVIPVEFVAFLPFSAAEAVAIVWADFWTVSGVDCPFVASVAAFVAVLTAVQVAFCHYYTTGILVWSRSWSDIW